MQESDLGLLAEGLILSASEVLQQLHGLTDLFAAFHSTPAELCHLRDAVLAHRELLENFCAHEDISLKTLKQKRAAQGFHSELLLTGRLVEQLNEIVQLIHGGHTLGPGKSRIDEDRSSRVKELPSVVLKTRWSSHRTQLRKLQKDLRDNCSRCLGEMLLMNVYVDYGRSRVNFMPTSFNALTIAQLYLCRHRPKAGPQTLF